MELTRLIAPNPAGIDGWGSAAEHIFLDAEIYDKSLVICDFASRQAGRGDAKAFLSGLRPHFQHITVQDAGNPATSPTSLEFWHHMRQLGLVDTVVPDAE